MSRKTSHLIFSTFGFAIIVAIALFAVEIVFAPIRIPVRGPNAPVLPGSITAWPSDKALIDTFNRNRDIFDQIEQATVQVTLPPSEVVESRSRECWFPNEKSELTCDDAQDATHENLGIVQKMLNATRSRSIRFGQSQSRLDLAIVPSIRIVIVESATWRYGHEKRIDYVGDPKLLRDQDGKSLVVDSTEIYAPQRGGTEVVYGTVYRHIEGDWYIAFHGD